MKGSQGNNVSSYICPMVLVSKSYKHIISLYLRTKTWEVKNVPSTTYNTLLIKTCLYIYICMCVCVCVSVCRCGKNKRDNYIYVTLSITKFIIGPPKYLSLQIST